jgi:hypothetical protein
MALPSLKEFAGMTLKVLSDDGIADYLPTVVVEGEFFVVEGIPTEVDHRVAMQRTINARGLERGDYLFGVRSGEGEVTIGRCAAGKLEFMLIRQLNDGFHSAVMSRCEWWSGEP